MSPLYSGKCNCGRPASKWDVAYLPSLNVECKACHETVICGWDIEGNSGDAA